MSHQIVVAARAERDLSRLPEKIATACVEFIYRPLAADPRGVGKPLRAELAGRYSARRGDFRIVYRVFDDQHIVEISHIDRRSDVYRR